MNFLESLAQKNVNDALEHPVKRVAMMITVLAVGAIATAVTVKLIEQDRELNRR